MAHVRDSLWRTANISSLAAVADDLAAEEVRKTLEVTDLDDALLNFIGENATGTQRYNIIILGIHHIFHSGGLYVKMEKNSAMIRNS